MKHDEIYKRRIRGEMNEAFSWLDEKPSRHDAIMRRIGEEKRVAGRMPVTLAVAIVLTLALAGAAVAAGLGLFGQLREGKEDESSYHRLGLLEDAAAAVGETRRIRVPQSLAEGTPETVREQLLTRQRGREYELTIDQVYCDGRKLYYAYTFRTNGEALALYEGEATGFDRWDAVYPGKRFEDVIHLNLDEAQNRSAAKWLNSHERGYVVKANAYVGDGAALPDGTYLTPVDSGSERVDEHTMTAYYEVALPEGYEAGESVEFTLRVLTNDAVYVQDENGTYEASLFDRAAVIDVPVKVPVTGETKEFTGEGLVDGYAAKAELHASDVDLSGSVRIEAPQEIALGSYVLLADGAAYQNLDEWTLYDGQTHVLNLRFDLPTAMNSLVLVPLNSDDGQKAIELR